MLFRSLRCNQNVVNINECVGDFAKNLVHETLKVLASVFEAKRRSWEYEQPKWGDYPCFLDIVLIHRDLMISLQEIDFAENLFSRELIVEVREISNGILIIRGLSVEAAVVATDAPPAARGCWGTCARSDAWLFGDHKGRSPLALSSLAYPKLAKFINLGLCHCQFVWGQFPCSRLDWVALRWYIVVNTMFGILYSERGC